MHYSSLAQLAALTAVAFAPSVSAHGYVSEISAGGKTYPGSNPVRQRNMFSQFGDD